MTEYVHLWVEGGAPRRLRSSQAASLDSAFIANLIVPHIFFAGHRGYGNSHRERVFSPGGA